MLCMDEYLTSQQNGTSRIHNFMKVLLSCTPATVFYFAAFIFIKESNIIVVSELLLSFNEQPNYCMRMERSHTVSRKLSLNQ
jgi:hypothetical protein